MLCQAPPCRVQRYQVPGLEHELEVEDARVQRAETVACRHGEARHPRLARPRGDLEGGAAAQRGLGEASLSDDDGARASHARVVVIAQRRDRKSTRLNSSHVAISYAVFCLKKKKKTKNITK